MNKFCARCNKIVYPIEEVNCLDKVWHKTCFRCTECSMPLNMTTYKGFDKLPYCPAHIPKVKATTIADSPELKRITENTKMQSNAKYHADFERARGKYACVAVDADILRDRLNSELISKSVNRDEWRRQAAMDRLRQLTEGVNESHEAEYFPATFSSVQQRSINGENPVKRPRIPSPPAPPSPPLGPMIYEEDDKLTKTPTHPTAPNTQKSRLNYQQLREKWQLQEQPSKRTSRLNSTEHQIGANHSRRLSTWPYEPQSDMKYPQQKVEPQQQLDSTQTAVNVDQLQKHLMSSHASDKNISDVRDQRPNTSYDHINTASTSQNAPHSDPPTEKTSSLYCDLFEVQRRIRSSVSTKLSHHSKMSHKSHKTENLLETKVVDTQMIGKKLSEELMRNATHSEDSIRTLADHETMQDDQQPSKLETTVSADTVVSLSALNKKSSNSSTKIDDDHDSVKSNDEIGTTSKHLHQQKSQPQYEERLSSGADFECAHTSLKSESEYGTSSHRQKHHHQTEKRITSIADVVAAHGNHDSDAGSSKSSHPQHQKHHQYQRSDRHHHTSTNIDAALATHVSNAENKATTHRQKQQLHRLDHHHRDKHQQKNQLSDQLNRHEKQPKKQQQKKSKARYRMYRALYDYDAQDTDEVSFLVGDVIIEVEPMDSGWLTGRVERTGKIGMLPGNYVAQLVEAD